MKKFICTGDIHLWFRSNVPEAWQRERYLLLFQTLIDLCKKHDAALIIAGDLFEKSEPELEEQQLAFIFFRMLKKEGIKVYVISGNHCTLAPGLDTFQYLDFGRDKTVDVSYRPEIWHALVASENTCLTFINHCNLPASDQLPLNLEYNKEYQNILISHFRCNYNQFVKEEIDVEKLLEPFDLCIVGDIHDAFEEGKLFYTNTPVNKEFQKNPNCGCLLLTIDNGAHTVERIPLNLPALIEVTCNATDEPQALNVRDFYRVKVSGTAQELKEFAPKVKAPNVKIEPSLVTEESLLMPVEEAPVKDEPLEMELIGYMQDLGYKEGRIARMMEVLA